MADIRHRVGIAAPQGRAFETLTTTEGLARWWTSRVDGDPSPGGMLRFFFGQPEPSAVMKVVDATPERPVHWTCVEGPDEWVGTNISFDLQQSGDETVVLFRHSDWREPVDFMHHCSTKWAIFLMSMKASLEGDEGTPFPDDIPISSWG